jgi:hypothetical protein
MGEIEFINASIVPKRLMAGKDNTVSIECMDYSIPTFYEEDLPVFSVRAAMTGS